MSNTMKIDTLPTLRMWMTVSKSFKMSGKMQAILGYILNERLTNPAFAEMCITSDGHVLARLERDYGLNEFIGSEDDLLRNLNSLADVLELSAIERKEMLRIVNSWKM